VHAGAGDLYHSHPWQPFEEPPASITCGHFTIGSIAGDLVAIYLARYLFRFRAAATRLFWRAGLASHKLSGGGASHQASVLCGPAVADEFNDLLSADDIHAVAVFQAGGWIGNHFGASGKRGFNPSLAPIARQQFYFFNSGTTMIKYKQRTTTTSRE